MRKTTDGPKKQLFERGRLVITPGALAALKEYEASDGVSIAWSIATLMACYQKGDWGECDKHDQDMNNAAVQSGGRIMGVYKLPDDESTKIWIITDGVGPDGKRHATTILLPEEY